MRPRSLQPIPLSEVQQWGQAAGLDAVGVTTAEPFTRARQVLEDRKAAGLNATMAFTYKNPERSTTPSQSIPWARSLVVGAHSYLQQPSETTHTRPAGTVARYAWNDPYEALRDSLGQIARRLKAQGWRATVVADENAIVDREAAWRAGIGWFGKNANLLLPGRGSWFVLGSVVTDAPMEPVQQPVADGCGTCRRCIDGCPTDAIIAPGVVDARRCIAWLVQAPGMIPRQYREAIGARIYGCDDCQEVCPPNRRAETHAPDQSPNAVTTVDLLAILAMTHDELLAHYGNWYLANRETRWLRRNALVALGNTASPNDIDVIAALARYVRDDDPMLRAHAVWAAARLGMAEILTAAETDTDPGVQDELAEARR
jgi:epoxyqueuosine reductase